MATLRPAARRIAARWLGWPLLAALGTFATGAAVGAGLTAATAPAALANAAAAFDAESPFPDRLTTLTVLRHNLLALGVAATGVLTFGVMTAFLLFVNGLLLGAVLVAAEADSLVLAAALVPHGVLELPAFWLVGAVAFRIVARLVDYLRGAVDRFLPREEVAEAVLLFGLAVLLLAVAAWVEATLTPRIVAAVAG
jgi:stage II sporulation protein M